MTEKGRRHLGLRVRRRRRHKEGLLRRRVRHERVRRGMQLVRRGRGGARQRLQSVRLLLHPDPVLRLMQLLFGTRHHPGLRRLLRGREAWGAAGVQAELTRKRAILDQFHFIGLDGEGSRFCQI